MGGGGVFFVFVLFLLLSKHVASTIDLGVSTERVLGDKITEVHV